MSSEITVVSGLPRSGTSMMMRMLAAGGVEVLTDGTRKKDEDNPLGYFEYERVKEIQHDTSWLPAARGKAFKMVSLLLYHLPPSYPYRIILMQRNIREIIVSQRKMLQRGGMALSTESDSELESLYARHLTEVGEWLAAQPHCSVLAVQYADVLKSPERTADAVNRFLGGHLDIPRMIAAVEPSLYRNRSAENTEASSGSTAPNTDEERAEIEQNLKLLGYM
ncbi:MAG: sulfotransferase [Alphaproteobacteria bacterium]|uniref:Sulfotransferase n=1 Tax=Candidatus Nitrobium versatile TaxID=2884831 RepID=A0A953JC39_9BACT|nr:sulfotransferase [Candidatus Nitrobium versatile]